LALPEGQLVVNSSQGGGSKDTWVVGREQLVGSASSMQGLVEGQAETETITVITPEMLLEAGAHDDHAEDHGSTGGLSQRRRQEEQQQQNADIEGGQSC